MAKRGASSKAAGGISGAARIVVLCGTEEALKRQRLADLRAALQQAHGEVETFRFDGERATVADVLDELCTFSLMQTYKLVIVDTADEWVKNHRAAVERYAEKPVDHATLVLRSTRWHPGNLDKLIARSGGVVKCDTLKPAEAQAELVRRAEDMGVRLPAAAAGALVQRMGCDLGRLENELAKLATMVEPGQPITPQAIAALAGRSSDETAWVLQEAVLEAIAAGRSAIAIAKAHELADLGDQEEVLLTYAAADMVRRLAGAVEAKRAGVPEADVAKRLRLWGPKIRPFFDVARGLDRRRVGRWFDAAVDADARGKSGRGEPMSNLERLLVQVVDKRA